MKSGLKALKSFTHWLAALKPARWSLSRYRWAFVFVTAEHAEEKRAEGAKGCVMMVLYFKCAEIAPQLCSRFYLREHKNNQIASCGVEMWDAFVLLKLISEDVIPPLRLERQLPSKSKWKHNFFK